MQCNNECYMDINCIIGVKKNSSFLQPFFGIYTNKFTQCLEEVQCIGINMVRLTMIILLYAFDIVFLEKLVEYIHKQIKTFQKLYINNDLTINIVQIKIMIIKSKKRLYP